MSTDKTPSSVQAELFQRLVATVRDYAIFMLDPTGHISTWNNGAEHIKGYAADEIVGRHFSVFYPTHEVEAGKCDYELEQATLTGRFEDEGWRIRKDGTRFWANVVITAMRDDDGVLIGFSKVTRDLTERKRGEEEKAARYAAEQANRAKDEFLAMLGHELRNPLAPIVTALQLMKLRGDPRTRKEQEIIERQVHHMARLVDDLLDVSRVTRGYVDLHRQRTDLRNVVADAVEVASPMLELRRHHFEAKSPAHPVYVDVDPARLVQVFANLIVNAAKYTDPGGHIRVHIQPRDDEVVVEVHDDGNGIDSELLPHVFDLFVQGYQGMERTTGGLGLGLTLVRSFVLAHGGKVGARSGGIGRGSTFTVLLPLSTTDKVDRSVWRGAESASVVQRRILVVDDNEDAADLLSELLSTLGHEVQRASDGPSALSVAARFMPDVAILDIGLPTMDGYVLATRLRDELGSNAPRLIALTGYGQDHDRDRSHAAGFDTHLVKPVDTTQLIAAIGTDQSSRRIG